MKQLKKKTKDLTHVLGLGGVAKGIGSILGLGCMSLQNMKNIGTIDSAVDDNNLVPGTSVIYFMTDDSVSNLVRELTKMRKDMKKYREGINKKSKKLEILINAADYKPNGRTNKRGNP